MTLFDVSVLFFFLLITVKAMHDTFLFWKEADSAVAVRRQVIAAPAHRPAPSRPSPSRLPIAGAERAVATKLRPVPAKKRTVA